MNPRLAEAMRPTRYNEQVTPPSDATGKAYEQPIEPFDEPKPRPFDPASLTPSHLNSKPAIAPDNLKQAIARAKRPVNPHRAVRETMPEDISDLMDESESGPDPSKGRDARPDFTNVPDPFPLQYRKGNPDAEFDISGDHGVD